METARRIAHSIATQISARPEQVVSAVKLLDEGSTVPFIARYRKETTGGLDEEQLRQVQSRLDQLRKLDARRKKILSAIERQGKFTYWVESVKDHLNC